jgi:alanyl-tRNA synthetase
LRTLETGIRLLDKVMADTRAAGKNTINGKDAFTLYDTYGFPLDLTELILKEHDMNVNIEEFDAEMQQQKERARNAAAIEAGDWVTLREGEPEFVGYDFTECDAEILRYRKVKQKNQEFYQIVLDRTPFYAEMGGQVGDCGTLANGEEIIAIENTKRENNLAIHISKKLPQDVTATFRASINKEARMATSCNHSATHLLHEALREVLGSHVEQKGSYVSPDSLRFDFSHFQKVTDEELRQVERIANAKVRMAMPLDEHRNMPIAEARAMGAMALFGEKYGDEVRVVKFGSSVELCGGTHVANTGNIGMIRIISESSIAAGIRRIEAITGSKVEEMMNDIESAMKHIKSLFNNAANIIQTIEKSLNENNELRQQVDIFTKERTLTVKEGLIKSSTVENGIKVIPYIGPMLPEVAKDIAFMLRGEITERMAFIAATYKEGENKPLLTVMLSDDLVAAGKNAAQIVRESARLIQGGGGGQPYFAQAGGKDASKLQDALDKMHEMVIA